MVIPVLVGKLLELTDATQNHTLQRKAGLTSGNLGDWVTSAGTNTDDSEWVVLENEDWTGLGSHNNVFHVMQMNMLLPLMVELGSLRYHGRS